MRERVFITGCGIASPLGCGFGEFCASLEGGMRGTDRITCFNTSHFPVASGGEARRGGQVIKTDSGTDRKALLANIALDELMASSGHCIRSYAREKRVMSLGAGIDHFDLPGYVRSSERKMGNWRPYSPRATVAARVLAERAEVSGGLCLNVAACVASAQAMGLAFRIVSSSPDTVAISGGFDSMLSPMHYMGFYKLGALSEAADSSRACKPFSKNRAGLVIGEGAALFTIENARNAKPSSILAEIAGYASSMDAATVTDPDPDGRALARAALEAIGMAGLSPDDIDCAHLHETGTIKNAVAEASAMRLVFGRRASDIPVFSLKGQTGHLIGACCAVETAAVIHCLQTQTVLPTVNFEEPDPQVPLCVVTERPRRMKINNVLKLNAAFGGQNAAIVFKKYEP